MRNFDGKGLVHRLTTGAPEDSETLIETVMSLLRVPIYGSKYKLPVQRNSRLNDENTLILMLNWGLPMIYGQGPRVQSGCTGYIQTRKSSTK
jgi:hypothetical protein